MKKRKFRRYDHSDGFFQGSKGPKGPVRKFLELWLENVWTLIPVNMVWVMLRVLLIPGGLAQAGMTYLCLEMSRSRHTFGIAGFFETIKKFWRKALPMGLGCCLASMFFLSLVEPYVWLQFVLLKLPMKKAVKNACILVFVDWKKNLLLGFVRLGYFAAALGIFLLLPYTITPALLLLVTVLFYPGLMHLLTQHCIFPGVKKHLIDPYYAEHPDEDLEKRKDMGLL